MADDDLSYYLDRARQEAQAAEAAAVPEAATAHRTLSVRYSAKALLAGVALEEEQPAFSNADWTKDAE